MDFFLRATKYYRGMVPLIYPCGDARKHHIPGARNGSQADHKQNKNTIHCDDFRAGLIGKFLCYLFDSLFNMVVVFKVLMRLELKNTSDNENLPKCD